MNDNSRLRHFPAKLLLFGEYTVLSGSRALAVPLQTWSGALVYRDTRDEQLAAFTTYLEEMAIFDSAQILAFRRAVADGLHFQSDIPQGYGVGSSGALCAAIYDQFFHPEQETDVRQIREALAGMEGFFHGQSSGMDPLVTYSGAPVLRESGQYQILAAKPLQNGLVVFLIDSQTARSTGALVERYLKMQSEEAFARQCLRPLMQSVDHAISFYLDAYLPMLWEHLQVISQLQFQYFGQMIHDTVSGIWEKSLSRQDLVIKLCGAGGGGYYLGFARDEEVWEQVSRTSQLKLIRVLHHQ